MKSKRWWIAGVLVFALAALLFWWGDSDDAPATKAPTVEFPTHLRPDEEQRVERRRIQPAPGPQAVRPAGQSTPAVPRRDSFLAALPDPGGKPAFVIEVNALRHSALGEKLIGCMDPGDQKAIDDIREKTHIDPLRDIDRLAFVGDTAYVSGFLDRLTFPDEMAFQPAGPQGQIASLGASDPRSVGLFGGQVAMFGAASAIGAAMGRLQGTAPAGGSWLPEASTYGDVYGVLPPEILARVLPPEQQAFAQQFAQIAQQVTFHVDAQNDVAMTFDVNGEDQPGLADLSKGISGMLQVARFALSRDKDPTLADLLDQAHVSANAAGGFTVQLVLPESTIDKALGSCATRGAKP